MDSTIQEFIDGKRIAVVGVSRSGKKFGNSAYKELKQRGYEVVAVHPEAKEIEGEPCVPSLASLRGKVDGALVVVPPAKVIPILEQAAEAGIESVWLQQGSESPAALRRGKELGLSLVSGKCILMYAQPVQSFHKFHGFIAKLIGQY